MKRSWTMAILWALAAPLAAQQARLKLDLPQLTQRASEVTDVSLDGAALKMGLAFITADEGQNDPDLKMLSRLTGIYVKSLEFNHANAVGPDDVAPIEKQLKDGGWVRLVEVRQQGQNERREHDEIYMLSGPDGAVAGMAIIAVEPHELNVVNIVGPINPKDLAALGGHFGIPKTGAGR